MSDYQKEAMALVDTLGVCVHRDDRDSFSSPHSKAEIAGEIAKVLKEAEERGRRGEREWWKEASLTPEQINALADFMLMRGELTTSQGITALLLRNTADAIRARIEKINGK